MEKIYPWMSSREAKSSIRWESYRQQEYGVYPDDEELPENTTSLCKAAHISQIPPLEDMDKKRSFIAVILDTLELQYEVSYKVGNYVYDFYLPETHTVISVISTANHNAFRLKGEHLPYKLVMNARYYGYRCINLYDWDKVEQILMSLKAPTHKVYARNCEIREISKNECLLFLMVNYTLPISMRPAISRQYGLFYNDELVMVMQFRHALSKKYEWELWRICCDNDWVVVGGASKLLKKFIDEEDPKSMVSYCNIDKFTGNVFNYLGIKFKLEVAHINSGRTWSKGVESIVRSATDLQSEFDLLENGWCLVNNVERLKYEYKKEEV